MLLLQQLIRITARFNYTNFKHVSAHRPHHHYNRHRRSLTSVAAAPRRNATVAGQWQGSGVAGRRRTSFLSAAERQACCGSRTIAATTSRAWSEGRWMDGWMDRFTDRPTDQSIESRCLRIINQTHIHQKHRFDKSAKRGTRRKSLVAHLDRIRVYVWMYVCASFIALALEARARRPRCCRPLA